MLAEHTAVPSAPQDRSVSLSDLPDLELARLWAQYSAHVAELEDCALSPALSEIEPMSWDARGIDHLGLRGIQRMQHNGQETLWVRNFPGLRTALPDWALHRRRVEGGLPGLDDLELLEEFTLTLLGRGRGLRERGKAVITELTEARCLTPEYFDGKSGSHRFPYRLTPVEQAALTDHRLTNTEVKLLELMALARRQGKLGLFGPGWKWGELLGVSDRTIRLAMARLEELGLLWRHYTPTEGTDGRIVDQAANMILPGPEWVRVDGLFAPKGAVETTELKRLQDHWATVYRKRRALKRTLDRYKALLRKAERSGEPPPLPPGGIAVSFGDWAAERLASEARLDTMRLRIDALSREADAVVGACADAIVEGDESLAEVYEERREERDAARAQAANAIGEVLEETSLEVLEAETDELALVRGKTGEELEELGREAKKAHLVLLNSNRAEEIADPSLRDQKPKQKGKAGPSRRPSPPPTNSNPFELVEPPKPQPPPTPTEPTPEATSSRSSIEVDWPLGHAYFAPGSGEGRTQPPIEEPRRKDPCSPRSFQTALLSMAENGSGFAAALLEISSPRQAQDTENRQNSANAL